MYGAKFITDTSEAEFIFSLVKRCSAKVEVLLKNNIDFAGAIILVLVTCSYVRIITAERTRFPTQ